MSGPVRTAILVHAARAWDGFHRRPFLETLASRLGDDAVVVIVDRPVTLDATLVKRPGEFLRGFGRVRGRRVGERIVVVTPWMLSHEIVAARAPGLTRWNRALVHHQLRKWLAAHWPDVRHVIEWVYHPRQQWVLDVRPGSPVVYECYDEYAVLPDGRPAPWNAAAEDVLDRRAAVTFVTSDELVKSRGPRARRIARFPNGIPDSFVEPVDLGEDPLDDLPRPRIGCLGMVRSLLDFPLLTGLAERRPEWQFVFVGEIHRSATIEGLRACPNVHFVGSRPHDRLPAVLRRFDVGLIPIVVNDFTRSSNPMRLAEYAAAGIPAVATPLPENSRFGNRVRVVEPTVEAFEAAIAAALGDVELPSDREAVAAELREAAREYTWSAIVDGIVLPALREQAGLGAGTAGGVGAAEGAATAPPEGGS